MTDQEEKLSHLLDGQPVEDSAAAVDELVSDVNLQYRLRRYRLIGEAMRHELPDRIDTDFHHRVMAGIREEDVLTRPDRVVSKATASSSIPRWFGLKPLAGMAVAATVAVVTVAIWQPSEIQTVEPQELVASTNQQKIDALANRQIQGVAIPASTQLQSSGMRWKVEKNTPGLQQKLNAYLVNHTEHSNSMQGLIPQARVAGFDVQQ